MRRAAGDNPAMRAASVVLTLLLSLTACAAQPVVVPAENSGYSEALLERINLYRLEHGLNPLQPDPALARLARGHCTEMFRRQKMTHRHFKDRLAQAGSRLCIENVGWNFISPRQMFDGWRQSRGHNRNLLEDRVSRVGIAEVGRYVTYFACD
jgi:uncharacterized protein YkwD